MWRLYVRFKVELLVRITGDLVVGGGGGVLVSQLVRIIGWIHIRGVERDACSNVLWNALMDLINYLEWPSVNTIMLVSADYQRELRGLNIRQLLSLCVCPFIV